MFVEDIYISGVLWQYINDMQIGRADKYLGKPTLPNYVLPTPKHR